MNIVIINEICLKVFPIVILVNKFIFILIVTISDVRLLLVIVIQILYLTVTFIIKITVNSSAGRDLKKCLVIRRTTLYRIITGTSELSSMTL